jgi:uncharacterized membrane protein
MAVLSIAASVAYVMLVPFAERFTEFYLLSADGKSLNLPRVIGLRETATVTLVVKNNEHETTTYSIEVNIDGENIKKVEGIILQHGEEWKQKIDFIPVRAGENQKVEFILYRGEEKEYYLNTYLFVNVVEQPRVPSSQQLDTNSVVMI